jgi:hypothetical protein
MPTTISWQSTISIPSGPSVTTASAVAVDAYDRIAVTIPPSNTEIAVDVQPGTAGKVKFLIVRSDRYGSNLTFKTHVTGNPAHALDDTLVLSGVGALELLGDTVDKLLFTNNLGQPANIEILVGRQATA